MASLFRVVFLGFIASFFILGIYKVFTNFEENGCEMTYMYQLPEYLQIPLKNEVRKEFPRYSLHLYGEGRYAIDSRSLKLTGIPVLFIPGNAGSHKQVRSLGSVALKMSESRGTKFHFNFFSLNLNEELSGLFGGVLWKQSRFAHECIKHILTLYSTNQPKSVVIVGHSMGGVVARALFTLPGFNPALVTTILTQASPHQAPVVSLDPEMAAFYSTVNDYWRQNVNTSLKYVTVFSTGGGFRDVTVSNTLVTMKGLTAEGRQHSTSTMSVPRGWVSTDHLCHVWCKQIVMATVRALFDMVDKNTLQLAQGPMYRLKVWRHHFESNTGSKTYRPVYDNVVKLDKSVKWELRKRQSWTFTRDSVASDRYSVVVLPRDSFHSFVAISNIDTLNWLGVCMKKANEETCTQLENFGQEARLIPPVGRKVVHVSAEQLTEKLYTHLVVALPKSRSRVEVMAEVYNVTRRKVHYNIPHLFTFMTSNSTLSPEIVINQTEPDAIYYNITIGNYGSLLDAYIAHLIVDSCKDVQTGRHAGSLMKLHVPWSNEDTYSFIRLKKNGNITLRLQTPRPPGAFQAELHLYLHPACRYKVVITRDWLAILGQFVRHYWAYLPAFIIIQVFMGLSWQFKQIDEEGVAPSFPKAHARWAQPWRVVPVALLLRFMLTYPEEASIANKLGLWPDDGTLLTDRGVWLPALPIFLYLTSYAFVELYAYLFEMLLMVEATVVGYICKSCCMSLRVLKAAVVLEYLALVGAAALCVTTCGTLGLLLVIVIYIIKTCTHYIWARETESAVGECAWNRFRVNTSILLLFIVTFALNVPSLIFWAKNLPFEWSLDVDPSRWTSFTIAISAILLTFADIPATITDFYSVSSGLLYVSSVGLILYATQSAHRLPYVVAANLLLLAAPVALLVLSAGLGRSPAPPAKKTGDQEDKKTK